MSVSTGVERVLLVACAVIFAWVGTSRAEELVFSDDFSAGLAANWTIGTNTAVSDEAAVKVQDGRVEWFQGHDYIESVLSFEGPLRVEVDLERTLASDACRDFTIELAGVEELSGVLRLQYGNIKKDTVNLGAAPFLDSNDRGFEGVCVEDETGYMAEMDTLSPHKGTATLTYKDGKVQFSYTNFEGGKVETPWKQAGTLPASKVRIWSSTKFRFVDAVRVYASAASEGNTGNGGCGVVNMENYTISLPCIMIDGVPHQLDLLYDPSIPGGHYWMLDVASLKPSEGSSEDSSGDQEGDNGGGTCNGSDIVLSVEGRTESLSLMSFEGFEVGGDGFYTCFWNGGESGGEFQLGITGLSGPGAGSTYVMSNTDPSHMSLVWDGNAYFPEDFTINITEWEGAGGFARGTFSATLINGPLAKSITLTDVEFCVPVVD